MLETYYQDRVIGIPIRIVGTAYVCIRSKRHRSDAACEPNATCTEDSIV